MSLAALLFIGTGGAIALALWKQSDNAQTYLPSINYAEDAYGLPRDLLARMAYQESHFRDDIIDGSTRSSAGATGLMQMIPTYFPGVDLTDPYASIERAAQYMAQLYRQFGSWKLAAAAYNAGPGNVQKYGGIPPFAETQRYVAEIFGDLPSTAAYS